MKKATLALAGLLAFSGVVHASESVNLGLGKASAFVTDETSFSTLPQVILNHKNTLFIELGNIYGANYYDQEDADTSYYYTNMYNYDYGYNGYGKVPAYSATQNGGLNIDLGPGVLGVWVNRNALDFADSRSIQEFNTTYDYYERYKAHHNWNLYREVYQISGYSSAGTLPDYGPRVDLTYAWEYSDKYNVALGVNRASFYETDWADNVTQGLSLGLDVKDFYFAKLVQLGFQYQAESDVDYYDYKANFTMLRFRAGADIPGNGGRFGRLEFGLNNRQGKLDDSSYVYKANSSNMNLGYAIGTSGDKGLAVMGVMYHQNALTTDYIDYGYGKRDQSESWFDLSAAGEAKVNNWLTLRAGVNQAIFATYSDKTDSDWSYTIYHQANAYNYYTSGSNSSETSNSDYTATEKFTTEVSLGASLTFGALTIDGLLSQEFLWKGPAFLTGGNANNDYPDFYSNDHYYDLTGNQIFYQLSASWAF